MRYSNLLRCLGGNSISDLKLSNYTCNYISVIVKTIKKQMHSLSPLLVLLISFTFSEIICIYNINMKCLCHYSYQQSYEIISNFIYPRIDHLMACLLYNVLLTLMVSSILSTFVLHSIRFHLVKVRRMRKGIDLHAASSA